MGATATQSPTAAALNAASGLVPMPATQLSHAAAIAAATNQFYEYQVGFLQFFFNNLWKEILQFQNINFWN